MDSNKRYLEKERGESQENQRDWGKFYYNTGPFSVLTAYKS